MKVYGGICSVLGFMVVYASTPPISSRSSPSSLLSFGSPLFLSHSPLLLFALSLFPPLLSLSSLSPNLLSLSLFPFHSPLTPFRPPRSLSLLSPGFHDAQMVMLSADT